MSEHYTCDKVNEVVTSDRDHKAQLEESSECTKVGELYPAVGSVLRVADHTAPDMT